MAVLTVEIVQRVQRLQALRPGLSDTDEKTAREGHAELTRESNGVEAALRLLIRRSVVWTTFFTQARRGALQHQAL